ncbi:MAG: LCP family protein [bacterium]
MEKIDLLKFHKSKHKKKKIAVIVMAIVFLIFGSLFLSYKIFGQTKELDSNLGFFASLQHLITSSDRDFGGNKKNINILLLGIGGTGHDGPYLTDTMLMVSINKADGKMAMLSIPRDLLIATKKFGEQKINAINSYAEVEKPGNGAKFTRDIIQELLQVKIDYYARMDFDGFREIIDAVGGVDIDVPVSFSDPLFPRESNPSLTTTVTFQKGPQHMSGADALVYARSRHGNNGEGSDFARSRRQQQIIMALKNKILSSETLSSLSKIKNIFDIVQTNINTNINPLEAVQLAALYKKMNIPMDKIFVNVLTNGPDGPLYSTYYNSQYVLLPKNPDFSDLRKIAANPFDETKKIYSGSYGSPAGVSILILNGTPINGLANEAAMTLYDFGYTIKETGNAPAKDFEKSVIYNLAPEDKADALADIKNILNANVAPAAPDWLKTIIGASSAKPDFVIVIGKKTT